MINKEDWLKKPHLHWQKLMAFVTFWSALIILIDHTDIQKDVGTRITSPFDFRAREFLGRSPEIHEQISSWTIDDSTVSWLGDRGPSLELWSKLLKEIDSFKPRAIIIDQLFSVVPRDENGKPLPEVVSAIQRLESITTPIYVGAFIAPQELKHRSAYDLKDPQFDPRKLLPNDPNMREHPYYEILKSRGTHIYGPDPSLRDAFKRVGHIMHVGDGKISPFMKVGNETLIPHLMLLPFLDSIHTDVKGFTILDKLVPTYSDGRVMVNFSPYSYYLKKSKSLLKSLKLVSAGKKLNPERFHDKYVYFIPEFFTGSTDFHMTPLGPMPGGLVHMAVLNSILQGQWLTPFWGKELLVVFMCLLGALIARKVGPFWLALNLVVVASGWIGLSIYSFSYHNFALPWFLPVLAFILTAISLYIEKSRIAEKKSQFIKNCLDGVIASEKVDALAKKPELINFSAREQVVTVMFIDIVGYSLVAENQLPRIAFDNLKYILSEISSMVHSYGGIVNKYLGDGLLCFFGYSIEDQTSTWDHAEKALDCAVSIQKKNLPKTLSEYERGAPVYPLRIGVNTSSVFIGNIGWEDKIDLTIVGNGVNFAKRLEGACTNHSILMGVTTKELIESVPRYKNGIMKRYVEIKHHVEMVETWELDPFFDQPEDRKKAEQVHRAAVMQAREDERWDIPEDSPFIVRTNVGSGKILNYSRKGMSVWIELEVIVGSLLQVRIDDMSGNLARELERTGLGSLTAEVCWHLPHQGGWTYGLRYKEIGDQQMMKLLFLLKRYSQQQNTQENKVS